MNECNVFVGQHCLASSLCLWLYGIIMESFDAITHHSYFYDKTQCDSAPRTDDGEWPGIS